MKDKMKTRFTIRRFILLSLLLLLFPVPVRAAEAGQTVRVGWYTSDHFQEGASEGERKSGYSYEYLQSVSNYTGWEYKYVSGGWSELYDAFLQGDIDLLAGVSYTEERAPLMNYPGYEMGNEAYYIYKRAGDETIDRSNLATLSGKRVGTLTNNLMTVFFEDWMDSTGAECAEVFYDDFAARDAAFESGEIDALIAVNNNVPSNSGYSPVVKVGASSYYLAVTKERTDLLDQLNQALTALDESNPYFTQILQIKYFQNTAVNAALSPEESQWLSQNPSIKVGCLRDYLPYCGTDQTGNVLGVITDILNEWRKQLGLTEQLQVEYVPYDLYTDLIAALKAGEIDTAFPIYDNIWTSEQLGIVQTNALVESAVHLAYRGEYSAETTKVIAVTDRSPFQRDFAALRYPESRIVVFDSQEACLDAVKQGKANCTFFSSGRAESYLSRSAYQSLHRLTTEEALNYCLGVRKGNNVMYSLLSRGVSLIDKSNMTNAMYAYVNADRTYNLMEFIQDHVGLVLSIALVFLALIALVAIMLAVSLRRAQEQKAQEEKMLQLVTEQKEELAAAKDRLEEAVDRAERASKAKTTFLFNMSHDIRTPMNAILGLANLAEKNRDDPNKLLERLHKIKSSGDVLMSILNNVLEMSRIEKGDLVREEEVRRVEPFYEAIYTTFQEQMERKGITFTKSIQVQHAAVYCDPAKLQEILLNILSNAWKYTPSGGAVSLSVEELPSPEEAADGQEERVLLRTTVRDTGRGMSPEFLGRIFEAFSRERDSEKNTIEGTGLGMAIVKNLVDLMDGAVTVESEQGAGTTVTVTIPHRPALEENAPSGGVDASGATSGSGEAGGGAGADGSDESDFTGKRILLAEDNDINAEILSEILLEVGFAVDRAEDGKICVDTLDGKPAGYYDLILMDIQMPNMDGYEATKAIRKLADPEKANIPIYAVTANAFEEDRQNAFAAGMNGHMGKPVDVEALLHVLSAILSN